VSAKRPLINDRSVEPSKKNIWRDNSTVPASARAFGLKHFLQIIYAKFGLLLKLPFGGHGDSQLHNFDLYKGLLRMMMLSICRNSLTICSHE
jgi:hypothetical protein